MKTRIVWSLAVAIIAALVTQSIRASTIVMTENSSTSLTVVENGLTLPSSDVINTSADNWTITLPTAVALTFVNFIAWAEPENATADVTSPIGWNTLSFNSSTALSIVSDTGLPTSGFGILLGNGDTGNVNTATETDFYTFNDSSDGAKGAPDTGSTFGLLALALAALFGASRLRSLRLA